MSDELLNQIWGVLSNKYRLPKIKKDMGFNESVPEVRKALCKKFGKEEFFKKVGVEARVGRVSKIVENVITSNKGNLKKKAILRNLVGELERNLVLLNGILAEMEEE